MDTTAPGIRFSCSRSRASSGERRAGARGLLYLGGGIPGAGTGGLTGCNRSRAGPSALASMPRP